jgi:hypothetical protein
LHFVAIVVDFNPEDLVLGFLFLTVIVVTDSHNTATYAGLGVRFQVFHALMEYDFDGTMVLDVPGQVLAVVSGIGVLMVAMAP